MELWNNTNTILEVVYNMLLIVLPVLAGLAATTAFGAGLIRTVRWAWGVMRPAVDEPTDPAIVWLSEKTGRTATWLSEFIISNGDQVIGLLPETSANTETVK